MKLHVLRLLGVGCVVVLLMAGCGRGSNRMRGGFAQATPAPVPTAVAHQTSVRPTVTIAGIIAPLQNVAISNSLTEFADQVYVNEGDHVHAGQVLAQLDTADLRAQLDAQLRTAASDEAKVSQARYTAKLNYGQNPQQVAQARQALSQAQHTLQLDTVTMQRDEQLFKQGYLQEQTYDQARTQATNDEASVRSAQAALNSAIVNQQVNGTPQQGLQVANIQSAQADAAAARAQAQQIRVQIAHATITSPVDGIVINRNLNPGEYPSGRTLFTIQELSHVYAELNASSTDVFRIRSGAPVQIRAGGDQSGHIYNGKIVAVLGQVQPGSTNFTVKAEVANPGNVLQAGIPVTGTIALPAAAGVGIPSTSFLDDTRSSVMLAQKGVAKLAQVREVASDGTTSIVTGLPQGARVISDGQLGLTDGQSLNGNASGAPRGRGRGNRRPGASPQPTSSGGDVSQQ